MNNFVIRTLKIAGLLTAYLFASNNQFPPAFADDQIPKADSGDIAMEEVKSKPANDEALWQPLYSAYSCVYHHNYLLASRWLYYALSQGSADQILHSSKNLNYLANGLDRIAQKREEASVLESSCDVQVLQALIQSAIRNDDDAIDTLKIVVMNNPKYPSIEFARNKLRAMEFEKNNNVWLTPPDVAQTGGKRNRFSRWKAKHLPLKIYIPPDAVASKVAGYVHGDELLMRSAFEVWQKMSNGKISFVFEPQEKRADIRCAWVSDQKDLNIMDTDAVGVCARSSDAENNILSATIRILTFAPGHEFPMSGDNHFRKNNLREVCLHEIGHSLGLNHSPRENDLMWFRCHPQPRATPSIKDIETLSNLYSPKGYDYLNLALENIESGKYKEAFAAIEKAICAAPKDTLARETICVNLINSAKTAIRNADCTSAIELLTKANSLATSDVSAMTKEQLVRSLHHAYLQTGQFPKAAELEKQNPALQSKTADGASFLDKYGFTREALPYYESALAKNPDNIAIRDKFCFLLTMLAKDEMNKNNAEEAISLLCRAKGILRAGVPVETVDKVSNDLRQAYRYEERYSEADQVWQDFKKFYPPPKPADTYSPEKEIQKLIAVGKKRHPEAWANPAAEKSQRTKLIETHNQYVERLQKCAAKLNIKNEFTWAASLIVRYKQFEGRDPQNVLGNLFILRRELVSLTDENAVVALECNIPPWKSKQPAPESQPEREN